MTGEAQVAALLKRGEANRSIGATDYNETSSRSHSLFQMVSSETSANHGVAAKDTHLVLTAADDRIEGRGILFSGAARHSHANKVSQRTKIGRYICSDESVEFDRLGRQRASYESTRTEK